MDQVARNYPRVSDRDPRVNSFTTDSPRAPKRHFIFHVVSEFQGPFGVRRLSDPLQPFSNRSFANVFVRPLTIRLSYKMRQ